MFKSHLLNRARQRLESQADLMKAAVSANSNYDGSEAQEAKIERLRAIDAATKEGIAFLYADPDEIEVDEDPFSMNNDPLFKLARQNAVGLRASALPPLPEQAGMGHDLISS